MQPALRYSYTAVQKANLLKTISLVFVLAFVLLPCANAFARESFAIVSLNPDFKALSKSKARMLFLGKVKTLQGKRIELSDWPSNNAIRIAFYQQLLGKDLAQMNAHWAAMSFSGKARIPKEIDQASLNNLLQWLSEKQARIGYAPLANLPENVNVLYVVEEEKQ